MRLVTWNLDGLEDRHLDARTEAACLRLLLRPDPPDVALFQEVVRRSLIAHLRPHFANAGYVVVPSEPPEREYFVTAMVRSPAAGGAFRPTGAWRLPFPGSEMGRELLVVDGQLGDTPVRVATAHLESLRPSRAERQAQLGAALRALLEHDGPAVFAGDTNLRDDELAAVPEVARVTDAWEAAGRPAKARATWFPRERTTRGMRFDRAFVKGFRVRSFERFGAEPVDEAEGMRISDHLGLSLALDPAISSA